MNSVPRVRRANLEILDHQGHKDQGEQKGWLAFQVLRGLLVLMDSLDKKEKRERLDRQVQSVQKAHLAQRDPEAEEQHISDGGGVPAQVWLILS